MAASPRVAFGQELFSDLFMGEAWGLIKAHKAEVAHYADIELEPDVDAYLEKQRLGGLRLYTARNAFEYADGKFYPRSGPSLVGYAIFVVAPNAHYKSSVQATQDVLFIEKQYRKGTGRLFIAYCEDRLRDEGVQVVYQHLKCAHDHPETMAALGYEKIEHVYGKRLDRGQATALTLNDLAERSPKARGESRGLERL